jgi:hypothetical protein
MSKQPESTYCVAAQGGRRRRSATCQSRGGYPGIDGVANPEHNAPLQHRIYDATQNVGTMREIAEVL